MPTSKVGVVFNTDERSTSRHLDVVIKLPSADNLLGVATSNPMPQQGLQVRAVNRRGQIEGLTGGMA